jgi:hypothetical protein
VTRITIDSLGVARGIYADDPRLMTFMRALGVASIRRASHVEPTSDNRWTADMAPSGGPVLGPFDTRSEALAAEVEWLSRSLHGSLRRVAA